MAASFDIVAPHRTLAAEAEVMQALGAAIAADAQTVHI